jgi:protein-tyrosine phosphatase
MFDQIYLEKTETVWKVAQGLRHLKFSGAKNFRDLGGYQTADGGTVRWGVLYRSDALHKLTDTDLKHMSALCLHRVIDFRSEHEKQSEPDRLPEGMADRVVEIPILDASTKVWHDARDEFVKNLKNIDSFQCMVDANTDLATRFSPEMKRYVGELLASDGKPILFHCAAGKDRTGFAAAILLRMLGVPQETVMQDYLLTNEYFLASYRFALVLMRLLRGEKFASAVHGFMIADPAYLSAAFETMNQVYGSFEDYVFKALGLRARDLEKLRALYLE